jgi:hypothetical protein
MASAVSKTMAAAAATATAPAVASVVILIDNSNLFIEGQKEMAIMNKSRMRIDRRFRVNMASFIQAMASTRQVSSVSFYGSTDRQNGLSAFEQVLATHNIKTNIYCRRQRQKEKGVDAEIAFGILDAVDALIEEKAQQVTLCVVSGDGDLLPAYQRTCAKIASSGLDIRIEAWAFLRSCSTSFWSLSCMFPGIFTIKSLADVAPFAFFANDRWDVSKSQSIPLERTLLLLLQPNSAGEALFKTITELATQHFKIPCMWFYLSKSNQLGLVLLGLPDGFDLDHEFPAFAAIVSHMCIHARRMAFFDMDECVAEFGRPLACTTSVQMRDYSMGRASACRV